MTLSFTIQKVKLTGEIETLGKDIGKKEAFKIVSKLTGYSMSRLNNKLKSLEGLYVEDICNKRRITLLTVNGREM